MGLITKIKLLVRRRSATFRTCTARPPERTVILPLILREISAANISVGCLDVGSVISRKFHGKMTMMSNGAEADGSGGWRVITIILIVQIGTLCAQYHAGNFV